MTEKTKEMKNEPESEEITVKVKTLDKEFIVKTNPEKKIEDLKQKIEEVNKKIILGIKSTN